MPHLHPVYDQDPYFSIDPKTRKITYTSNERIIIIQGDHNSDVVTFKVPRIVDGHDMQLCNLAQVHYINIDSTNSFNRNTGVYEVLDFHQSEEDPDNYVFSWHISKNATAFVGTLSFSIRLACMDGSKIDYAWCTAVCDAITVAASIDNTEIVVEQYTDVLEQWYWEFVAAGTIGVNVISDAKDRVIAEIALHGGFMVSENEPESENVKVWFNATDSTLRIRNKETGEFEALTMIKGEKGDPGEIANISQELGHSETIVPSQKAVTEYIDILMNAGDRYASEIEALKNSAMTLKFGTEITSLEWGAQDVCGNYYYNKNSGTITKPTGESFILRGFWIHDNHYIQLLMDTSSKIFIRSSNSDHTNGFSDWVQIAGEGTSVSNAEEAVHALHATNLSRYPDYVVGEDIDLYTESKRVYVQAPVGTLPEELYVYNQDTRKPEINPHFKGFLDIKAWYNGTKTYSIKQTLSDSDTNRVWTRTYTSDTLTWSGWVQIAGENHNACIEIGAIDVDAWTYPGRYLCTSCTNVPKGTGPRGYLDIYAQKVNTSSTPLDTIFIMQNYQEIDTGKIWTRNATYETNYYDGFVSGTCEWSEWMQLTGDGSSASDTKLVTKFKAGSGVSTYPYYILSDGETVKNESLDGEYINDNKEYIVGFLCKNPNVSGSPSYIVWATGIAHTKTLDDGNAATELYLTYNAYDPKITTYVQLIQRSGDLEYGDVYSIRANVDKGSIEVLEPIFVIPEIAYIYESKSTIDERAAE